MAVAQPGWIEHGDRQLYSVFHPSSGECGQTRVGVLFVPALLHEQPRSRRLATQIAEQLSQYGLACLRFDFHGTGDSSGSGMDVDFDSMRMDLDLAINELRGRGVDRIAVLAMRGGSLPAAEWLKRGGNADAMILWEPILDGAAWLDELEGATVRELASTARYPLRRGHAVEPCADALMGFDVSRRLLDGLAASEVSSAIVRHQPSWVVLRQGVASQSLSGAWPINLPDDVPEFGSSIRMDAAMFVSPRLKPVVEQVGLSLGQLMQAAKMEAIA